MLTFCSFLFFFFFSSRRRHTRCLSDWSSDVCSSDLRLRPRLELASIAEEHAARVHGGDGSGCDRRVLTGTAAERRGGRVIGVGIEIGRASCRERGERSVVAGEIKRKRRRQTGE